MCAFVTFISSSICFFPPPPPLLLLPPLRPLLRVHALVPPQVSERAAGVAALNAAVRFLAGVRAGVALQVDELSRGIRADGAAVRLLAIVDPHVAFEVVGVTRGEGAERAGVQFGGDLGGGTRLAFPSPLPVGVSVDGSVRRAGALHRRGVEGGGVLKALLTA